MKNTEKFVGTEDELQSLIAENDLSVIYIATENCSTCEVLKPKTMLFMAEKFPQLTFISINAENYSHWVASQMIFSAPMLLIFAFGKEEYRGSRYLNFVEVEEKLNRLIHLIND